MTALTLASRRTLKPTSITLCQVLFLLVSSLSSSFNPGIYSLFQLAPCFSMLRIRIPKKAIPFHPYRYGYRILFVFFYFLLISCIFVRYFALLLCFLLTYFCCFFINFYLAPIFSSLIIQIEFLVSLITFQDMQYPLLIDTLGIFCLNLSFCS